MNNEILENALFQEIVVKACFYCDRRNPEALDRIFDNLPPEVNNQIMQQVVAEFNHDPDVVGWFCSYVASEINASVDNDKPHAIADLTKALIKSGFEPFQDFAPYPVCRIVILTRKSIDYSQKKPKTY